MASSREGHYRGIRKSPWHRYYSAEIRDPCKKTGVWMQTFDTTEEAKTETNFPAPSSKTVLSSKKSKPYKSEEKVANVKVPLDQFEFPKQTNNCVKLAGKNLQKGMISNCRSGRSHGSINAIQPLSHGANKCNSCGSSIKCRSSQIPSKSHHASIKRSLGADLRMCRAADATKLDCKEKITLTSLPMCKSDNIQRPDGAVSALVHESACLSSQLTTPTTYALSTPIVDLQISPKKALRAAMLKSRFANTILKAQQNLLLVNGGKANPMKMQREKKKLEIRLCEEKAKIEAQIRAAEAVAKLKAEVELKKQREKEREAARIALQRMENRAGIELNLEIVKELDILSGCTLSQVNPLHQLGLFIKDENSEDNDYEAGLNQDLEEGEILL